MRVKNEKMKDFCVITQLFAKKVVLLQQKHKGRKAIWFRGTKFYLCAV